MAGDRILDLLEELCRKSNEIKACMVAKKGLEGVVMFPETFKRDVGPVWEPLSKILNEMLCLIEKHSIYNMDKTYIEALGYGIGFYVLDMSDTALIVFLKQGDNTLKTLGNLSGEIEKTRSKIV